MKKLLITAICFTPFFAFSQAKQDKAIIIDKQPGYYENSILKGVEEFQQKKAETSASLAPVKWLKHSIMWYLNCQYMWCMAPLKRNLVFT